MSDGLIFLIIGFVVFVGMLATQWLFSKPNLNRYEDVQFIDGSLIVKVLKCRG